MSEGRFLVDTSAWIETLRPVGDPAVRAQVSNLTRDSPTSPIYGKSAPRKMLKKTQSSKAARRLRRQSSRLLPAAQIP